MPHSSENRTMPCGSEEETPVSRSTPKAFGGKWLSSSYRCLPHTGCSEREGSASTSPGAVGFIQRQLILHNRRGTSPNERARRVRLQNDHGIIRRGRNASRPVDCPRRN